MRKTIGDTKETSWAAQRAEARAGQIEEITQYINDRGLVTRPEILEKFDLTESQLGHLVTAGLETHLILSPGRDYPDVYTRERILDAVRAAWAEEQRINPASTGLSHSRYDKLRGPGDPSGPLVVSRYGWAAICAEAGVPAGATMRDPDSYGSTWSEDDILDWVEKYVRDAGARKVRPSFVGYEEWQLTAEGAPSGSTVRNRLRDADLRTWPAIAMAAVNRS